MAFEAPEGNQTIMVDKDGKLTNPKTIKGGIESNVLLGEGYTIQKGWYYNWIDKSNLGTWDNVVAGTSRVDFYLTSEQTLTPAEAKPAVDTSFASGWAVNDIISIVDNDICVDSAKITAISGNKITVALIGDAEKSETEQDSYWLWYSLNNNTNGWRPLGDSEPTKNDYSLYVTAKPNVGGAEISGNILNIGDNTANGACSATIIGSGNYSKKNNTLTVGKRLINNNNYSVVVGEYNKDSDVRYRPFTVGCGDGENNRVNALEVDRVISTEGKSVGGKITSYIGNFVKKLLVAGVDVYESLASKLTKENNLSDVANKATARTNLEVYSKSETDTKLEAKQNALSFGYGNRLVRTVDNKTVESANTIKVQNKLMEIHTDDTAVSKTYTKYSPTAVQVFTEVDSAAKEMATMDKDGFKAKSRITSSGATLGATYQYYAARLNNVGTGEYVQTTAGGIAFGKTGEPINPLSIVSNISSALGITHGVRIRNSDGAGAYVTLSGEFGYCVTNVGTTQPLYYFDAGGRIFSKDIITESGFSASQTQNEPYHGAHPCVVLPDAHGGTFNVWKGTQAEYDALAKRYNSYIYFVVQTDNSVKMYQGTDTLGS